MTDGVTTGIGPLDHFLGGGLPAGFCTVLVAPPGSGAEIFAKQFAACASEKNVVFVSTDESLEEVMKTVEGAGWSDKSMHVLDIHGAAAAGVRAGDERRRRHRAALDAKNIRALVEGTDSRDLLSRREDDADFLEQVERVFLEDPPPDRVVIHTVDFFLQQMDHERTLRAMAAAKEANQRLGGQLLLVLSKGAFPESVERRIEIMADCLIELEMSRKGTKFDRYFMVKKVRNRTRGVGVSTYQVGADGFSLETLERIV